MPFASGTAAKKRERKKAKIHKIPKMFVTK